jgi:hypothetical protein
MIKLSSPGLVQMLLLQALLLICIASVASLQRLRNFMTELEGESLFHGMSSYQDFH